MTYTKPVWLLFHSEYNVSRYFSSEASHWRAKHYFVCCTADKVCWSKEVVIQERGVGVGGGRGGEGGEERFFVVSRGCAGCWVGNGFCHFLHESFLNKVVIILFNPNYEQGIACTNELIFLMEVKCTKVVTCNISGICLIAACQRMTLKTESIMSCVLNSRGYKIDTVVLNRVWIVEYFLHQTRSGFQT